MARRTQLVHPTLCVYDCVLEYEWDDEDRIAAPRLLRFHSRCSRHAELSEAEAEAAVVEESERFNAVVAELESRGVTTDGVTAEMKAGILEVRLPSGAPRLASLLGNVRYR